MPESAQHARLVDRIVRWVVEHHGAHPGLCIFRDGPEADPGNKPFPVGGFVPDVVARTVPSSFLIIGEAKWYRDLETRRSRRQLHAYLEHLALQPDPRLVIAIPWPLAGTARSIVRNAKLAVRAERVESIILPFETELRS